LREQKWYTEEKSKKNPAWRQELSDNMGVCEDQDKTKHKEMDVTAE
jgi:hypothetical protein